MYVWCLGASLFFYITICLLFYNWNGEYLKWWTRGVCNETPATRTHHMCFGNYGFVCVFVAYVWYFKCFPNFKLWSFEHVEEHAWTSVFLKVCCVAYWKQLFKYGYVSNKHILKIWKHQMTLYNCVCFFESMHNEHTTTSNWHVLHVFLIIMLNLF